SAQLHRSQGHRQSGPLHEDPDGILRTPIHLGRFCGRDHRDHGSCSPTATAMTKAEVSVCVMVTRTSVTPSISARRAALPVIFTLGAPPPVISMSEIGRASRRDSG